MGRDRSTKCLSQCDASRRICGPCTLAWNALHKGQRSDESKSAGTETGALNFITYLKRHTARAAR
jgi:hypothetical protein